MIRKCSAKYLEAYQYFLTKDMRTDRISIWKNKRFDKRKPFHLGDCEIQDSFLRFSEKHCGNAPILVWLPGFFAFQKPGIIAFSGRWGFASFGPINDKAGGGEYQTHHRRLSNPTPITFGGLTSAPLYLDRERGFFPFSWACDNREYCFIGSKLIQVNLNSVGKRICWFHYSESLTDL